MSAAQLLTELESLGVKVWPDAGALRFKAPAKAMTPELAARVKAVKPELLAILTAANDPATPAPDFALMAAIQELDIALDRLCELAGYGSDTRQEMRLAVWRMAPDRIGPELEYVSSRIKQFHPLDVREQPNAR